MFDGERRSVQPRHTHERLSRRRQVQPFDYQKRVLSGQLVKHDEQKVL
jgi:hypothetical protein